MSDKTCSNIHEGHRKRLRESYIKSNGSDALRDHQLLELLLFYAIPRRDVNPLAHRLVNRFGSLRGVLEASFSELAEEGVSQSTAILIKLVGDINFRANPSGDPKPSALDIENTRRLRLLLNEVGIDMQEHIIVCSSACYAIVRGYSRSTEHFGSTSDTAQKTCTEDKPVRITVSNSGA